MSDVVPKPPAWDAKAAKNAWAALRKPDGITPYSVFQNDSYVGFTTWTRGLRDHLEALRVGVFGPDGVKPHLDKVDGREMGHYNTLDARVSALEDAPNVPFPGSG